MSISNISEHFAKITPPRNSILGWRKNLIDVFFAGQTSSTNSMVKILIDHIKGKYHRVTPAKLSKEQIEQFGLDSVDKNVLDNLISIGNTTGHIEKQNDIVVNIFKNKKATKINWL